MRGESSVRLLWTEPHPTGVNTSAHTRSNMAERSRNNGNPEQATLPKVQHTRATSCPKLQKNILGCRLVAPAIYRPTKLHWSTLMDDIKLVFDSETSTLERSISDTLPVLILVLPDPSLVMLCTHKIFWPHLWAAVSWRCWLHQRQRWFSWQTGPHSLSFWPLARLPTRSKSKWIHCMYTSTTTLKRKKDNNYTNISLNALSCSHIKSIQSLNFIVYELTKRKQPPVSCLLVMLFMIFWFKQISQNKYEMQSSVEVIMQSSKYLPLRKTTTKKTNWSWIMHSLQTFKLTPLNTCKSHQKHFVHNLNPVYMPTSLNAVCSWSYSRI